MYSSIFHHCVMVEYNLSYSSTKSSLENVNLNTLISYTKDGDIYNFLDDYNETPLLFITIELLTKNIMK